MLSRVSMLRTLPRIRRLAPCSFASPCSGGRYYSSLALQTLSQRGFIHQCTHEQQLDAVLQHPAGATVYLGVDPTADGLHVGHLVTVMALVHLARAGHRVIGLVGGATALIGDPSGRRTERPLLGAHDVQRHADGIARDLRTVLNAADVAPAQLSLVDNMDWYRGMSAIEYLRDVGTHFRLGSMLAKESVRSRVESDDGMSFTEFSYQTLQAYDFLHLFRKHDCTVQLGGSDQWGNITAGVDLIRRVEGKPAFGITVPLLTTAAGDKFGKSAGNAVWLEASKTSPYELYQFFYNTADEDLFRFMKLFTLEPVERIDALQAAVASGERHPKDVQDTLASLVTRFVHGEEALKEAKEASAALFEQRSALSLDGAPTYSLNPEEQQQLAESGLVLARVAVACGACSSRSEANRLQKAGALYVNQQRVEPKGKRVLTPDDFHDQVCVLRVGKKKQYVVRQS